MRHGRSVALVFILCLFGAASGSAGESLLTEEDPLAGTRRSLRDEVFVVETTEEDADESLNRVSGIIDLGIADPAYVYKSENHGSAGPFARADAFDAAAENAAAY